MSECVQWQDGSLLLICHLQPGASRSEWAGEHGDVIKIRIKAPPVDGKANAELIRFLAAEFSVSKRAVSILSGELNRRKRVSIEQPTVLPSALNGLIPLRPV
ncbi:MAG TPA: YggU family protein [Gammaproteobacteria bacterium]|nr:YggU family protein [Gammaproteobacteria bacterium]